MKKLIFILVLSAIFMASCNTHKKELEQLKQENEVLKKNLALRDQDISSFMQVFNEIGDNIAQIKAREQLIAKQTSNIEAGQDKVAVVKDDLMAIDELMRKNRENIQNLSAKLKSSRFENKELLKMVANLERTISDKDIEIVGLVKELETLNYEVKDLYSSVSKLESENVEKGSIINNQDKALNQAFYLIGTEKDLKEKEVITKKGGFAGIGRVEKLNQDLNQGLFTEIDIREKNTFPIDGKKVKLLTNHPSDSYIIRKNDDDRYYSFEITKPEEFWRSSKYMVLTVD
jgi:septal ring factor EnvC (AmiA/AmiB activator)